MTRKIDIERIEIYGIKIPSNETLHVVAGELEALEKAGRFIKNNNQFVDIQISSNETRRVLTSELTTLEKVKKFINNNNQIVRHMRSFFNHDAVECCRSARIGLRLMNNIQAQCKLTGIDFPSLWYSVAVITWFGPVMGYLERTNPSDLKKSVVKKANTFIKTGVYDNATKYFDDVHNLNRFMQFRLANDLHNQCSLLTYELSKNNQEMKDLLIQHEEIMKEWVKIADSIEPQRICRFCLSVFNVKTSPDKWKSCGSRDCKLAYIRANREKNHPKRGWIHDPTAQQPCIGMCGSDRKQLNSNRVCFGCYEPFS
jgi:hypothetical protein